MDRRSWALIALVYLAFAEVLSWTPVPDLSLCLIQPEHNERAADDNGEKYCPAFHTGIVASLDAMDGFLEQHDKSVVAGFTIVLALSTIGLWRATNRLWVAGERQIQFLRTNSEAQERDTQILQRAYLAVNPRGIHSLSGTSIDVCVAHICIRNVGRLPARNVTWFITSTISENPAFKEMDVDRNLAAGEVTIAPGIEAVQGGDLIFASDLEKAQESQPTGFCYVWGVVYYLDGFDEVRGTRFCHRYNCANFETVYEGEGLKYIKGKTIAAETARIHRYGNDAT